MGIKIDTKICPLLRPRPGVDDPTKGIKCRKKDCEWWNTEEKRCAVPMIEIRLRKVYEELLRLGLECIPDLEYKNDKGK